MRINISTVLAAVLSLSTQQAIAKITLDQSHDLIFEQFLTNTFALQLLQAKNKFDYNTLVLGGMVEGNLQHWDGNKIRTIPPKGYKRGDGLYLTQTSIDFFIKATSWGEAFLSVTGMQIGQDDQSGNYFYLPHAFINIGNLEHYPTYLTLGINTIPFGIFTGTCTWDIPLTSAYFNPQQVPQVNLAFYKNNLNLNAFVFIDEVNYEHHFALSLSYNNTLGAFSYSFGSGYLTNLKTNSTGNIGTIRKRKHFVPEETLGNIWEVNGSIGYKLLSLAGEFLVGSHPVLKATNKPAAYSLTLLFTPTLFEKVTTFGINHSASFNFKDIPTFLPGQDAVTLAPSGLKSAWAMSISRPIFTKNITLGLDVQKAQTYENAQTLAFTINAIVYI